jgi:hypothetical protein
VRTFVPGGLALNDAFSCNGIFISSASVSRDSASSCHQVKDKDDQCYHQQEMNQAAGDVKAESEKPENQEDYEYCPEHFESPLLGGVPGTQLRPGHTPHVRS